jgi:hypothetical protein
LLEPSGITSGGTPGP